MTWKKGTPPPGTYGWGGVVLRDEKGWIGNWFRFAEFYGTFAMMRGATKTPSTPIRIEFSDIAFYDASLCLPMDDPNWESLSSNLTLTESANVTLSKPTDNSTGKSINVIEEQ